MRENGLKMNFMERVESITINLKNIYSLSTTLISQGWVIDGSTIKEILRVIQSMEKVKFN